MRAHEVFTSVLVFSCLKWGFIYETALCPYSLSFRTVIFIRFNLSPNADLLYFVDCYFIMR